jgi:hypothetical protein
VLDFPLFFCLASRLFVFSSFGFVFWISQSSSYHHLLFRDGQFFGSFLLPRLVFLLRLPFPFKRTWPNKE